MDAPRIALSIAGSDPTGGAGLQLDLRVFALLGVHGLGVPAALTVQSTERVRQVLPAFPGVVRDQLVELLRDVSPHAIKIGALATDDIVLRIADVLAAQPVPRVVDPVLRASSGAELLERRAIGSLLERVVRGAALVTPNLDEAEQLTGTRDPEAAAHILVADVGAQAALVKGGHATGEPNDYLFGAAGGCWLEGQRVEGPPVHGTGCALSSAIAAGLARGTPLEESVRSAKAFVARGIQCAFAPGGGQRLLAWPIAASPGAPLWRV